MSRIGSNQFAHLFLERRWQKMVMDEISNVLRQYIGGEGDARPSAQDDFERVASGAPKATVAHGLAEAFRSDQTPSFGRMVANLFGQSTGDQKAGLLNTLLFALDRAAVSQAPGGTFAGLQDLIKKERRNLAPEDAQKIAPAAVERVVSYAAQRDPSIVETVSRFYAEHPEVVETLGTKALTMAMHKIASR
jgi:hypothetical protein